MKRLGLLCIVSVLLAAAVVGTAFGQTDGARYPVITPENAAQLTQVSVIGRGQPVSVALTDDVLAVSSSVGVWLYKTTDFATPTAFLDTGGAGFFSEIAFSPDGRRLAVPADTLQVWDVVAAERVLDLDVNGDTALAAAFSLDGSRLAVSGMGTGMLRVYDAQSGDVIQELTGHDSYIADMVFSADGTRLITGGNDAIVREWDIASGEVLHTMDGHSRNVTCVALSPDETWVASGAHDGGVWLWNIAEDRRETLQLSSWLNEVAEVIFNADGSRLISVSQNGEIVIWDVDSLAQSGVLDTTIGEVSDAAVSPDGSLFVVSGEKRVGVWDTATGTALADLSGFLDSMDDLAFSPDGSTVLIGGSDRETTLWPVDLTRGWNDTSLRTVSTHVWGVQTVDYSPDGAQIAVGTLGGFVSLWNAVNGRSQYEMLPAGAAEWVNAVVYNPAGSLLAAATSDGQVTLIDPADGSTVRTLDPQNGGTYGLAFNPNGALLVTGGFDSRVQLWDVGSGRLLFELAGHTDPVFDVAFAPDDRLLATAGRDVNTLLWDTATWQVVRALEGVRIAAFSPNGQIVVTLEQALSTSSTFVLWETATGAELARIEGHASSISQIAFSPDGTVLATLGSDGTVRFWVVPVE